METRSSGGTPASRWERRPNAARLVRLVAWATPVAASSTSVLLASRALARPHGLLPAAAWWAGLSVLGTVVLLATERLARRLLPLAALLRLSLSFPDAAPSRFGVVLRNGNSRTLERSGTSRREPTTRERGDRRAAGGERVPGVLSRRAPAPAVHTTPAEATAELARLVAALHNHDRRTRGHCERVRAYSVLIGNELRLPPEDLDRLQWAALLHDIGKITVPPELLNKPGRLTDDEFEIVKAHPAEGARLIEPLRWWLGEWADASGQHHERFDGTGYPLRLSGTSISYAGRIVAVADAYDVMTAARSYKKPLDSTVARTELTECAGTHFDPVVVRALLSVSLGRLQRATGPLGWLANVPILSSAPLAGAAASALQAVVQVFTPQVAGFGVAALAGLTAAVTGAEQPQAPTRTELAAPDPGGPTSTAEPTSTTAGADPAPAELPQAGVEDPAAPVEPAGDGARPPLGEQTDGTTTTTTPAPSSTEPPATVPTGTVPETTTTTEPYRPSSDVVIPLDVDLGTYAVARAGSKTLSVLAQTQAAALLYGACETGTFEFSGSSDPIVVRPQGATQSYRCEFQADRADGTTVRGSFTVQPT